MVVKRKARPYSPPLAAVGHKRVIPDGLYAYFIDENREKTVHAIAHKSVSSGLVGAILRPVREYRLNQLVTTVETPALYDIEDSLGKDEEMVAVPFSGKELARAIIETEQSNEGE